MQTLDDAILKGKLNEEGLDYLLSRGVKEATYSALHCLNWIPTPQGISKDPGWLKYGKFGKGKGLEGWLLIPFLSPKANLLGFEARRTDYKKITRYLKPEASWNPVWLGLTPLAMKKIWEGANLWITEGFFDLAALEWCIPPTDVVLGSVTAKLSFKHIEFLRRFCTGYINLVYDNDEAGQKGVHGWTDKSGKEHWGALKKLRAAGLNCRQISYSGGKDPGEIWDFGGAEGLRQVFNL